ncbi:hypothetical protein GCM10023081_46000 [Arthrobacter ginkgonis]|uniref:HTH araC/xylS-type domain-containing protein n=2 Tax=Arthrobacter ginkgonis TaxID=1630594 RepID=A0ABP7DEJ5_9MICC
MTLQLASEGQLTQNGRSSSVPAGAGVFYETRRPYEIDNRQDGQRQFTVRVARAALDVADSAVSRTCGEVISPRSPELRVLRTTIASLHEECEELSIEAREDLGDHVLDMIASLIRRQARPSMSTPRLMRGLMAHIEENIHSPELNVTSLAAACFVSERSVYEAFAGMGYAPAAYITNLRMQQAERYLMEGRSVQVTAGLCGYSDPSTFIRAFRRVHHTTPKAWVDGKRGR